MIMHSDKKVICIKDIPSNIIEEAIFILKENSSYDKEEKLERNNEIILSEAENIVEEYINKIEYKSENVNQNKLQNYDFIKELIFVLGILIILGICIFIVI